MVEPRVWKGAAESLHAGVLESVVLTVPRERTAADIKLTVDEQLEAPLSEVMSLAVCKSFEVARCCLKPRSWFWRMFQAVDSLNV